MKADPRKVEVIEEWLHNVQHRIGMTNRMSRNQLEYHVKDFMIRHQRQLGLSPEDVE